MFLVLIGPSGSGKTTQAQILIDKYNFKTTVSYTTRTKRYNEVDGVDYHFISKEDFEEKQKNNFFFEYSSSFDNYYGTSNEDVEAISKDQNIVMCFCPKGFDMAVKNFQGTVVGIYLMPPSKETILARLNERKSSQEEIDKRLKSIEVAKIDSKLFKHIIEPTSIKETTEKILEIIKLYS